MQTVERPIHHDEHLLPADVLLSVQGVSKTPPRPLPQPPRWLARVLPGVQWSARGQGGDDGSESADDDEEMEAGAMIQTATLKTLSFDVAMGGGLGIVGPDLEAKRTLSLILLGFLPPSTGRIAVRGRIAPLLGHSSLNVTRQLGRKGIFILARFLGWPVGEIKARWGQIEEFAAIDQITEYPPGTIEYETVKTKRLLLATVLHLDASVYLVDHRFYERDPDFVKRCYHVLAERQRAGCAVIQMGHEIEDVSRFCHEAMWLEKGEMLFRGRLGEVAKALAERVVVDESHALIRVPLRASLLSDDDVYVGPNGGIINVELDVFTKSLETTLSLVFADDQGHETLVEQPEAFVADDPGVYRLRVAIPGGLLAEAAYSVKLRATAEAEADPHELIAFDVDSQTAEEGAPVGFDPSFGVMPGSEELVGPDDVEWSVRRA